MLAALAHVSLPRRVDAFRRFSLLWRVAGELRASASLVPVAAVHALVDALHASAHEETLLRLTARTWLAEALATHVARLLDPLLEALLDLRSQREPPPGLAYQSDFATGPVRAELRRLTLLGEVAVGSFSHATLSTALSPSLAPKARAFVRRRSPSDAEEAQGPLVSLLVLLTLSLPFTHCAALWYAGGGWVSPRPHICGSARPPGCALPVLAAS